MTSRQAASFEQTRMAQLLDLRVKQWHGLAAGEVETRLPELLPVLRRIPLEDISLDNLLWFVSKRELQLWVWGNTELILLTEIVHHPKHTVLVLKFGAGRLSAEAVRAGRSLVIPWAKSYGCTKVEVAGRPGWARVLGLTQKIPIYRGELK